MLRPIVIEDSVLLRPLSWLRRSLCVSAFPLILCTRRVDQMALRRHSIRFRQRAELWILPFYVLYLWHAVTGLIRTKSVRRAYYDNPFEAEAYAHQDDPAYLTFRPRNAWRAHGRR